MKNTECSKRIRRVGVKRGKAEDNEAGQIEPQVTKLQFKQRVNIEREAYYLQTARKVNLN